MVINLYEEQRNLLAQSFETWKGNLEQVDDVTIISTGFYLFRNKQP